MTGRDVIEVDVKLRLDALLSDDGSGCTILMHSEPPVIVVRDVYRVQRRKLANLVLGLLEAAELDVVAEFDRNRAVVRPSGDFDPNQMGEHGRALLNQRSTASRASWYWSGYKDGLAAR